MAPPARVWKKLRIEPYDPDAQDGDGDGIVQEGTAWERPAGTRILDASSGAEVTRGSRVGAMRSGAYRIVKKNPQTGKFEDVDYERSYDGRGQALGAATPLSDVGADSLVERGALSIRESTKPPDVIRPEVGVDSEVTGPPVFKRGDPVGKVRDLAESVLEKHGVPRTTDEAFAILRTVFPNLSKNQPSDRELKRGEFDVFVGLLVAAETMPPGWVSDVFGIAFNEQDTLGLEREKSRAEVSRGKFSDVDILGAAGMHINFRSNKISGITEDALTSRAQSDKTVDGGFPTVAQEIYVEARKAGYSHEDALSMLTIAVAVHESAHALHFHKAQKHAGISLDNATDEQIVAAIAAVDGIDADDLLKETLAKYQNNLKRNRRALMQKYPGVFKKRKIEDIAPDSRGMSREQRFALARNLLADRLSEIERKHNWDGLTEEEVRASLSEMSPVSDYGQATVLESVAEAISAQVLDVYDFGDEPPLLMQWLLGGDEDVVRSEVPKGNESIGPSDVPAWEGGDSAGDVVRARNEEIDRQLEEAGATFGTSTVETLGAPEKDDFGRPVGGVPSGMADKAVKDRKAAAEEVKNSALKRFAEIRSVLSGDEGSESESMAEVRKAVSLMSPEVQEFYRDKSPEELLEVLLEEVHGYKEGIAKTQVHLGSNFGEEVSILYGVLDSGRVKNQAESGASKGATSAPELRTQYEMTIGLPADLPPELRPVSGVALHRDVLEEQRRVFRETYGREPTEWDLLPDLGGGDQYGQIRVVLKPEVNERSAIGFDDTLNTVNPVSSMSNDDPEDTLVAFVGQRHPFSNAAGNAETIDRLIEGRVTGTQQKLNIKSTANKVDPELEERRASEVGTSGRSYVEALVPGGVEAEDIEGVEIPYGFFEDRLLPMIESDPELNDWYQKTFLTLDGLVELGLSESEAQEFLNGLTEQQKSLRSSIPEAKGYVRHVVGRRLMDRAKEKGIALKILDDEKIVEETGKFGVDRWDPKTWGKESERELIEARRDLARKRILKSVEDQRKANEESGRSDEEPQDPEQSSSDLSPEKKVRARNVEVKQRMKEADIRFTERDPGRTSVNAMADTRPLAERAEGIRKEQRENFVQLQKVLELDVPDDLDALTEILETRPSGGDAFLPEQLISMFQERTGRGMSREVAEGILNFTGFTPRKKLQILAQVTPERRALIESKTPDELVDMVTKQAMKFQNGLTDIRVRMSPKAALGVIQDGRVKSMHEDSALATRSLSGTSARNIYETSIGFPEDADPELRPISGYVVHPDVERARRAKAGQQGNSTDFMHRSTDEGARVSEDGFSDWGGAEHYGSVVVKLRPEVSERSAVANGDTLTRHLQPSLIGTDDEDAVLVSMFTDDRASKQDKEITALRFLESSETDDFQDIGRMHSSISTSDPGGEENIGSRSYMEALVPGGIEVDDIEEIKMPAGREIERVAQTMAASDAEFKEELEKLISVEELVAMGVPRNIAEAFLRGENSDRRAAEIDLSGQEAKILPSDFMPLVRHLTGRAMLDKANKNGIKLTIFEVDGAGRNVDVFDPTYYGVETVEEIELMLRQRLATSIIRDVERSRAPVPSYQPNTARTADGSVAAD